MSFSLFINFGGECREALTFYAKVFRSEVQHLMKYSDAPPSNGYVMPDEDKNRVMYAHVNIFGTVIMFSDFPSGMELIKGNNLSPTLGSDDEEEIRRVFGELSAGGEVGMELQKTFWSDLYGMVTDKFGITWQLSHDSGIEYVK